MNDQRWAALEAQLRGAEAKSIAAMEERFRHLEATNAAQWDAIEQLLLALYRQPDARSAVAESEYGRLDDKAGGSRSEMSRAHAANYIR